MALLVQLKISQTIGHDFKLPPLATLRRLAGTAHNKIKAAQWTAVCGRFSPAKKVVLGVLVWLFQQWCASRN